MQGRAWIWGLGVQLGLSIGARRGSPCHLSFHLPRVHHPGEAGVGRRGLGAPAGISSAPPPHSPLGAQPRVLCWADARAWVQPGGLGPQTAGSGQAGGCEFRSPSPAGPPGAWSLSPLGPRLATSSHSALRPGQQPPLSLAVGVHCTDPVRLSPGSAGPAETGPGHRVSDFWSLPGSATLPTPHPLGALRLSGASLHLADLGATGLGTPLRSASQAEQGAQLTQSSVHWVDGAGKGSEPPKCGAGRARLCPLRRAGAGPGEQGGEPREAPALPPEPVWALLHPGGVRNVCCGLSGFSQRV